MGSRTGCASWHEKELTQLHTAGFHVIIVSWLSGAVHAEHSTIHVPLQPVLRMKSVRMRSAVRRKI